MHRAPAAFCGGGFFLTQRRKGKIKKEGERGANLERKEPGWMNQPGIAKRQNLFNFVV